jgi:hypothetical protein
MTLKLLCLKRRSTTNRNNLLFRFLPGRSILLFAALFPDQFARAGTIAEIIHHRRITAVINIPASPDIAFQFSVLRSFHTTIANADVFNEQVLVYLHVLSFKGIGAKHVNEQLVAGEIGVDVAVAMRAGLYLPINSVQVCISGIFGQNKNRILPEIFGKANGAHAAVLNSLNNRHGDVYSDHSFVSPHKVALIPVFNSKRAVVVFSDNIAEKIFSGAYLHFIFRPLPDVHVYFIEQLDNFEASGVAYHNAFRAVGFQAVERVFFFARKQQDGGQ